MKVYKVTSQSEWAAAESVGSYHGSPLDLADGFIHLSAQHQYETTIALHFAGQPDLVLLEFDAQDLGESLRWERSRGGDLFPHLYGDLPTHLCRHKRPLRLRSDGSHEAAAS